MPLPHRLSRLQPSPSRAPLLVALALAMATVPCAIPSGARALTSASSGAPSGARPAGSSPSALLSGETYGTRERGGLPTPDEVLGYLRRGTPPEEMPLDFNVRLATISDMENTQLIDPGTFLPELESARTEAAPLLRDLRSLVSGNRILSATLNGRDLNRVLALFRQDARNYILLIDNI